MKSIELFSGTGGLALGLQQAGFDHEALFEWDKDSCDNIKRNIANGYPGVNDWTVFQSDLRIEDFYCQFLSVDDIWIPLTESLLIERFKPVWNRVLDGFGNHDPGKGRHSGKMPFWDCLHPGRAWAERLQPCAFTAEELEQRVRDYLREAIL